MKPSNEVENGDVILETRRLYSRLREEGASQVGVEDCARGINDADQLWLAVRGNPAFESQQHGFLFQLLSANGLALPEGRSQLIQDLSTSLRNVVSAESLKKRSALRVLE